MMEKEVLLEMLNGMLPGFLSITYIGLLLWLKPAIDKMAAREVPSWCFEGTTKYVDLFLLGALIALPGWNILYLVIYTLVFAIEGTRQRYRRGVYQA